MLNLITCNKSNYEKKLFSYVNNVSMNNKRRSEIVSNIIKKIKKNKNTALINYTNELENNNFKNFKSLNKSEKFYEEMLNLTIEKVFEEGLHEFLVRYLKNLFILSTIIETDFRFYK